MQSVHAGPGALLEEIDGRDQAPYISGDGGDRAPYISQVMEEIMLETPEYFNLEQVLYFELKTNDVTTCG